MTDKSVYSASLSITYEKRRARMATVFMLIVVQGVGTNRKDCRVSGRQGESQCNDNAMTSDKNKIAFTVKPSAEDIAVRKPT
jgi:hypothetical protein